MQGNKNNRNNVKVFDSSNNIAGIPKSVLFFVSAIPLLIMLQVNLFLGFVILCITTVILLKVYKDDDRALSVWFYSFRDGSNTWVAGFKPYRRLVIMRKYELSE